MHRSAGYDAGKKIKGKNRHVLVDTLGLLLHAIVHPTDIQDRDGGVLLLATLFGMYPFLQTLFADAGYQGRQFHNATLRSLFAFDGPVHGLDRGLYLQELLKGLFCLAAVVGTGEHFGKCSPLLDQLCARLFEIVAVLFAHDCLPRAGSFLAVLGGIFLCSLARPASSMVAKSTMALPSWLESRGRLACTPLMAPPSFSHRWRDFWLGLC
jgi:hypothetical protein